MRTEKSNCFISYNKLGPFTKLATGYSDNHGLPLPVKECNFVQFWDRIIK